MCGDNVCPWLDNLALPIGLASNSLLGVRMTLWTRNQSVFRD